MVSIDVLDRHDPDFLLCLNFLGMSPFLSRVHYITMFISEQDLKFPRPLRHCLLGFREGMTLFKFFLSQLTGVIRQKGYVYSFAGQESGTSFEVCFISLHCFAGYSYLVSLILISMFRVLLVVMVGPCPR